MRPRRTRPRSAALLPRRAGEPDRLSSAGCQGSFSAASGRPSGPPPGCTGRGRSCRCWRTRSPRGSAGVSAAAGTSTMTPGVLRPCSRTLAENHSASLASAIIGAITHTSDELRSAAREMACSWRSKIPDSSNATGTPRTPSAGLGSSPWSRKASGLSAPASSVRTTTFAVGEGREDARVGLLLLGDRRLLGGVEEQELGAEQAHALRARGRPGLRTLRVADVGQQQESGARRTWRPRRSRSSWRPAGRPSASRRPGPPRRWARR